ncbi:MAG: N-acetylmuramic acid 6-phosphate etherase [Pseudonocardiaceae bacterium]|nr:N-acetylmuramic acid 6-phosphate etherase [Pseudonocardiaceae bacterium]
MPEQRAQPPTEQPQAPTERRNPRTVDIDRQSSLELLRTLHAEDALVPDEVAAALPQLAVAVDLAVTALGEGGRVHYFGAGTSGRLALLDAVELGPTYALPGGVFVPHQAGGPSDLLHSAEGAEDDADAGVAAAADSVQGRDVALGLSASGRTPYVRGALGAAHRAGAATVLLTSNPAARPDATVDVLVAVDTGPEAVAGSTRMKAGTAQKLMLTAFSTAVMVRTGRTYSNLMVDMVAGNAKLRARTVTILAEATGLDAARCAEVLAAAGGELKTALVSVLGEVGVVEARRALAGGDGHVRRALDALR